MAYSLLQEERKVDLLSDNSKADLLSGGLRIGSLLSDTQEEEDKQLSKEDRKRKTQVRRLLIRQQETARIKGLGPLVDTDKDGNNIALVDPIDRPRVFKDPEDIDLSQVKDFEPITPTDIMEFLFGSEMAVIGIDLDNKEAKWSWENMKDQWSEEPLWLNLLATGSLAGSIVFPAIKAGQVSLKFGKLGAKLPGFRRASWAPFLSKTDEIEKFKGMNLLPTDPTDPAYIANADDLSDKALKLLRMTEHRKIGYERTADRMARAARGEDLDLSFTEAMRWKFQKRFSNSWWKIASVIGTESDELLKQYHTGLESLWKSEDIGRFFVGIPDEGAGPAVRQYQLHLQAPNDVPMPSNLSPQDKAWADYMFDAKRYHQQEAWESGFIDDATRTRIGEVHDPAQLKGTPGPEADATRTAYVPIRTRKVQTRKIAGEEASEYVAVKTHKIPRLDSPTLLHRGADVPEIYQRLLSGQLITDQADLTMRGYVTDRLLINNFKMIRDIANSDSYAKKALDVAELYGENGVINIARAEGAGLVRLDNLAPKISERIRRMLKKVDSDKLGPNGELPWVTRDVFDQLFGESGTFTQIQTAVDMLELGTTIHKTSKCVVGDTRILTSNGYIKIKDAYEYKEGFNLSLPDDSLSVWSPILNRWEKPLASYYNKESECIKISFRDGSVLEGTYEHPIMSNGEWVKLKHLKVGNVVDECLDGKFPEEFVKVSINPWNNTRIKSIVNSFEGDATFDFDEDYAELIGWILGDGSIRKGDCRITIGGKDYDYSVGRLKELCKRTGLNYNVNKDHREDRDIYYFTISNKKFVEFLDSISLIENGKKKLIVPEIIFKSPKSVVCAFIKGLMDTDGSVCKRGSMVLSSKSEFLMRDVQLLIKSLGVPCSINSYTGNINLLIGKRNKTYKNYTHWQLRFSSNKRKIVEDLQLFGMPRKLNRVTKNINERSSGWKNKVKSIDYTGKKPVYDISLNSPHAFVGNTIVSHQTGLSIPTHMQNLVGNWSMLMQAGFNPLTSDNLRIQGAMAHAFNKIAKVHRLAKETGESSKNILDNMAIDLGNILIDGKTFNLNEEILNPAARELFEESAFSTVEGFSRLEEMIKGLRKEQRMTRAVAKTFLKTKKLFQMGDKEGFRWFDQMTKWYLGEDMVPKMAYFMKLRGMGLSQDAAILEVGRRLPMYSTVGSSIRQGRKIAFPWLTFPTEAARITKNNLMDYPLKMAPWLRLPEIMQSAFAGMGGLDYAGVEEAKKALPMYAHKSNTIIGSGRATATFGGGLTGAVAGAVAGGIAGGGPGGLFGAVAGGAAGAMTANAMVSDDNGDALRGMILDWLPHSSFMLTSTSPYMGTKILPFKDLRGLQEQLPAEPFALLKPILDVTSGQTGFGTPVGGVTFADKAGKAFAGLMGFLAPPWIQKYGLRTSTPDVSVSQYLAKTVGGTKGIPGDFTNVSRLLIDMGVDVDPNTGKPGSLVHDTLLKNLGMGKSWVSDPYVRLRNEVQLEGHLREVRATLARNLSFHISNGEDGEATEILKRVMSTFTRQYGNDPRIAQAKYGEWIETKLNIVGKHPQLRTWSIEELTERLRKASAFAGKERGKARLDLIKAIRDEIIVREIATANKIRSIKP